MSRRRPANVSLTEIKTAVKAVANAGVQVGRVEIDKSGKIVVFAGKPSEPLSNESEWDRAIADLKGRK